MSVPPGAASRPTRALVREAVFDMLSSLDGVEGAVVADLFAGSGALGIEALSRGAVEAAFVDSDRRAAQAIRVNLAVLGAAADRGRVVCSDVTVWARGARTGRFDLVLCDPPYAFGRWGDLLARLGRLLSASALLVAESKAPIEVPEGWVSVRQRSYGTSVVSLVGLTGRSSAQSRTS